jgi:hypothetical protein
MRVYEVMSKAVETVKPAVHASEAKTRMRQKRIHHLVVRARSCKGSCPTEIWEAQNYPKCWVSGRSVT